LSTDILSRLARKCNCRQIARWHYNAGKFVWISRCAADASAIASGDKPKIRGSFPWQSGRTIQGESAGFVATMAAGAKIDCMSQPERIIAKLNGSQRKHKSRVCDKVQ
jgi:hypothetical protein